MSGQPGEMRTFVDRDRGGCLYAVVLSTSRHKRTYDRHQAERDLNAQLASERCETERVEVVELRSHTRAYLEAYGCEPECEWNVGPCCTDGDGAAWESWLVAYPASPVSREGEQ